MIQTLVVNECFGPTVQGEGASAGRRCGFVRLGRCNQQCQWCDEPQTWAWDRFDPAAELHEMAVDDVVAAVEAMDVDMVVVTGGEPLLQQQGLEALLRAFKRDGKRVEIETARAQITVAKSAQPVQLDQLAREPLDPGARSSKQISELPHREQWVTAQKVEDLIAAGPRHRRRSRPAPLAADESARDRAANTR